MKLATALIVIILAVLTANIATWWWNQRVWFDLQSQQLATIKRLEAFPPAGADPDVWKNALVSPYNVWGNVTYTPGYSNIGNDDLCNASSTRLLLRQQQKTASTAWTEFSNCCSSEVRGAS